MGWIWSSSEAGDVQGPASATDNAFVRFDGTTGKLVQDSPVICDDSGNVSGVADFSAVSATISGLTASRAVVTGVSSELVSATATAAEVDFLSGVTSAIQTQLNGKEPTIAAGTTADYWRGDKSWQALDWAAVDKTTSDIADITSRSHTDLTDKGTNTHAQIDTHISSTANPHSVDIDQVTPTTTKGDIIVEDGANAVRLGVGADTYVLMADSSEATGVKWAAVVTSDELVKVSANDTTGDYLDAKLVVDTGSNTTNALEATEVNDGADEDLRIRFDESKVDHTNIDNIGTNSHAQIDTHIGSSSNPHSVDIDQVTPTTTKGDLLIEDGANVVRLAVGTDQQMLVADSSASEGVSWADQPTAPDPITSSNDNRLVRVDSPNALQDSGITVNDSDYITDVVRIGIGESSPGYPIHINGASPSIFIESTSSTSSFYCEGQTASADQMMMNLSSLWDGTIIAEVQSYSGVESGAGNKDAGYLIFSTTDAGVNSERMRIDQDGPVHVTSQFYSEHDTESGSGSTHTIDWNDGNSTTLDLQGFSTPLTVSFSNGKAGASYVIKVVQASSDVDVTFSGVLWPSSTAPTITSGTDAVDIISLFYDGTNYYGTFSQDFS